MRRTGTPLWRQLLRIGRAAGRGARGGRLRFVALLCATAALCLGLTSVVAGFATYDGRALRGADRAPVFLPRGEGDKRGEGEAAARWRQMFDTAGGLQHDVITIEPLRGADSPLPPGVAAWPGPGQAVLSPALRAALATEGSVDRYGKVVGTIGAEGLSVPGERLAYVHAPAGAVDPGTLWDIAGYGSGSVATVGDQIRVQSLATFTAAVAGLTLLPAGALVVIAARSGAAARDRRTALLGALGAGRRARALVDLGEAAVPVALGALFGTVLVLCAQLGNVTVPVVDFALAAADLRRWGPQLYGAVAAAAFLVLAAVLLLHRAPTRSGGTRPTPRAGRVSRVAVWSCPVFLLVGTRGPGLADPQGTSPLLFLGLYAVGVVGTLATLPAVVSLLVRWAGRGLVRLGNRRGRPGPLIAGRWNMAQPGVCARMVAGVVIAIGLVSQIQLWSSRLNEPMLEARAVAARVGESMLVVGDPLPKNPAPVDGFLGALPPGVHGLGLHLPQEEEDRLILRGPCAALTAVGATCGGDPKTGVDHRLRELDAWYGSGHGTIQLQEGPVTDRSAPPDQIVLVGADRSDLPVAAVKKVYYQHMAGPSVSEMSGEWLVGAAELEKPATWVMFLGLAGVVFLTLAAGLNNLGDFLGFSCSVAPVSVLTGSRRVFAATAWWTIGLPLALAAVVGTAAAVWLGTPLTGPGGGATQSWPVLLATLAAVELLALLFWTWATATATREAMRWRPRAD
ncbi:ABC transporter permease [Streptomyces koyangensis]|uniref:ABC transporter permease n=1 Tax=Streptomyces koyangensis TaxID=188770 RepID=UPI003D019B2F